MSESGKMRKKLQLLVDEVLQKHLPAIRSELVEQLARQWPSAGTTTAPPPPDTAASALLNAAQASIQDSLSQTEILGALLDGASRFAPRVALFVVRAGAAAGWSARGLDADDALKSLNIDLASGLAARVFQERVPSAAAAAEFDPGFRERFGAPARGTNVLLLPLVVRNKVVALLYADAGPDPAGPLDSSALECLARGAGLWLELVAARKAAGSREEALAAEPEPPTVEPEKEEEEETAPQPVAASSAEPGPAPEPAEDRSAPVPMGPAGPEEEEIHRKARRFAKLLVDEIKLYNKTKVDEGRQNRDLYSRLEDDIVKSRSTYDKRYGNTPAAKGDYFNQELIRNLANNDQTLLGAGFLR